MELVARQNKEESLHVICFAVCKETFLQVMPLQNLEIMEGISEMRTAAREAMCEQCA